MYVNFYKKNNDHGVDVNMIILIQLRHIENNGIKYIYNGFYIILFNKCYIIYNYIVFHEAVVN